MPTPELPIGAAREDRAMRSRGLPWLNPKLVVRPSSISGLGLHAFSRIARNEECCRLAGRVVSDEEFARYVAEHEHYSALAIGERLHLVQSDDDPTNKGNHSCDPNMWLADAMTVIARRPIEVGEEATIDYALVTVDEGWSMNCRCGSAHCRSTVRGSDWRRRDLQRRYRDHWSPFIAHRIERSADA